MRTLELIQERHTTHGRYRDNARVAQSIKQILRCEKKWEALSATQRETLDMIATKIGRIMSGDPNVADHWADIAGYAELIVNEIVRANDADPQS